MNNSWPYRADLSSFSKQLFVRTKKQVWRNDSLAKAEKMLFVGFLFVRKLIECSKVTDQCAKSSVKISRGPINRSRDVSQFLRDDLIDDLDSIEWSETKIDVHQLADKIVHTWWIIPVMNESSGLGGFIFTTDRKRNSELWFLPTSSIIEIFERFARSPIRKSQANRDEKGRLTYWRAE